MANKIICDQEIMMDYGEAIHVRLQVRARARQDLPFSIISATWELLKQKDEKLVIDDAGDCSVSKHVIDAFISPSEPGDYILRYTYYIADETWVDNIKVIVR